MAKPAPLNPQSETERVVSAIQAITRDLLLILEVSRAADTQQWQSPPRTLEDTADIRRPDNTHSDPTGDTATNETRLHLHHQHDATATKLEHVATQVHKLAATPPKRMGKALDHISIDTRQTAIRFDNAHRYWHGT